MSIFVYSLVLLFLRVCFGKLGLGGDVLVDFTRTGVSQLKKRRSGRRVKHVDFIIFQINDKIVKQFRDKDRVTLKTTNNIIFRLKMKSYMRAIKHTLGKFTRLRSCA